MKCPNCGVKLAADDRFCAKCGFRIENTIIKTCKKCGKKLSEDAMFCSGCGAKLEQPGVSSDSATIPTQPSSLKTTKRFIVPESLYFATYIAISDNRLFDREWYQLEDVIKEMNFDESVRNNVLNIILDRPEKIALDRVIEVLAEKSPDVRYTAMKLGLEVAYSDGSFGEKESVVFQGYRSKFGIDSWSYSALCKEVQSLSVSGEGQIVVKSKSLSKRYEKCLFSADAYSDVIKNMSVIAKEDIDFASKKVDRIAQMYRVYPQMLKKQTDSIISHQSHLNNNDDKEQLQAFFKELLESIDNSLERANESVSILQERQSAASNSFTISFMGRTKAGKSTLHSVLLGGLNNEFIGRGSERTTRYNYV